MTRLLRLEGLSVLVVAVTGYASLSGSWLLFGILFLAPDLAMLGYVRGPRLGAAVYNAGHAYLAPAVLGLAGWWGGYSLAVHLAVIWTAHIGFDRLLGYGLKLPTGFRDTHLGTLGQGRSSPG
ncbi:MAG: DUF4260 family protein [Gemmatimonadales bacterium]|nr:MAG: DUF4260 family protein [Gemmatimonadales bacterium]